MLRGKFPSIVFSSVYKTAAREREDQDDFLNAVARFETEASAGEIMTTLREIERTLKKDPPYPKGPRTIDLDLLLLDDEMLKSVELEIPHPGMITRRFVLEPLCELIGEDAVYPGSATRFSDLLKKTLDQRCERTGLRL